MGCNGAGTSRSKRTSSSLLNSRIINNDEEYKDNKEDLTPLENYDDSEDEENNK